MPEPALAGFSNIGFSQAPGRAWLKPPFEKDRERPSGTRYQTGLPRRKHRGYYASREAAEAAYWKGYTPADVGVARRYEVARYL